MKTVGLAIAAALWTLVSFLPLRAQDAAGWGGIKGRIVWGNEQVPERKPVNALGNVPNLPLSDDWVVNPKNKGVRWTFVWLSPAKDQKLAIHPDLRTLKKKEEAIDQPALMIEPHALALREGQDLVLKNSSTGTCNVRGMGNPAAGISFNYILPAGGSQTVKGLAADRLPIVLNSDCHPWMKGYIRVFDHPYYAVTDESGNFEMKLAPAGTCKLMVWHGTGGYRGGAAGKQGTPIMVKAGAVLDLGDLPLAPK